MDSAAEPTRLATKIGCFHGFAYRDTIVILSYLKTIMMNKIIRYFDLASGYRSDKFKLVGNIGAPKIPDTWMQWLALFLGVFVQPFYKAFTTSNGWYSANMWHWLFISGIISCVLFPSLYKETLDPAKKVFPQLCIIFTGGLGWQSIIVTAIDTVAQAAKNSPH